MPSKRILEGFPLKKRIIIWGWTKDNPSFLLLLGGEQWREVGFHRFELQNEYKNPEIHHWPGNMGHFPSFQREGGDPWERRHRHRYNRQNREEANTGKPNITYADIFHINAPELARMLKNHPSLPADFRPVEDPNEILKLQGDQLQFLDLVINMLSNPRIYSRKKALDMLIAKNPPKSLYQRLLQIGSSEFISGLFLQLAKVANPVLKEEATAIIVDEIEWVGPAYANGIRRCARLYLVSIDAVKRQKQIETIRNSVPRMNMWPKMKVVLESDNKWLKKRAGPITDPDQPVPRKIIDEVMRRNDDEPPIEPGPFNTEKGEFRYIDFKHTMQMAEIFDLPDVIGKLAYFLDTPPINELIDFDQKSTLNYFQRYIVRVINKYARESDEKFLKVFKQLMLSYTPDDYVGRKYKDEFATNVILTYYLYNSSNFNLLHVKNKIPSPDWQTSTEEEDIESWERIEFMPDLWDRHLTFVAELARDAKIKPIWRFAYVILSKSPKAQEFFTTGPIRLISSLVASPFMPLTDLAKQKLLQRVNAMVNFDPDTLLALIDNFDPQIQGMANNFYTRTHGTMTPTLVGRLLLSQNAPIWRAAMEESMASFNPSQFADLVKVLLNEIPSIIREKKEMLTVLLGTLYSLIDKVRAIPSVDRKDLAILILDALNREPSVPEWLLRFLQDIIFTIPLEDLLVFEWPSGISANYPTMAVLLEVLASRRIPSDTVITDVTRNGSSRMVNLLVELVGTHAKETPGAFTSNQQTMLLLFESTIKPLNDVAATLVANLPPDQVKLRDELIALALDSPVIQAFRFGLARLEAIYGEKIPRDLIVRLMEHGAPEVKGFVARKCAHVIETLGDGDVDLFIYYVRTLLFLPNRCSPDKNYLYQRLVEFATVHPNHATVVENLLLELGSTSVRLESERALVALATIHKVKRTAVQSQEVR